MKKLIFALAALACLPLRADTASDTYKQGLEALEDGNVEAARTAFSEVLRLQPGNANARYQLNELGRNQDSLAARARAKEFAKYTIEQIDFNDVEASQAISALGLMVEKKAAGKFSPNFMIQDPSKLLEERMVTLQVKNLPANAALKMILDQANAVARYDKHAIVISPRGSAKPATETAPAKADNKPAPAK